MAALAYTRPAGNIWQTWAIKKWGYQQICLALQ